MPFPLVERVTYKSNPLDSVVCQARFPTILRIDTELPSVFQEKISREYPILKEGREVLFDIQLGNNPNIPREDTKQVTSPIKNYEFASEDEKWKVNLTRNFIALSTSEYVRWEEFRKRFTSVLDALVEVYKPALFTRIGLRYADVIVRSKLNLEKVDWCELIEPPFLGILASSDLKGFVKHFQSTFIIGLADKQSEVRVITGIVKAADSGETCFMIDSDYYDAKKHKKDEVLLQLDLFHSKAYAQFRSCITEKLHNAMRPQKTR